MAFKLAELFTDIRADTRHFDANVDKSKGKLEKFNDRLKDFANSARKYFLGLTGFAAGMAYLQDQQLEAERSLNAALLSRNAMVYSRELIDAASALQAVTTHGDEAIMSLMAQGVNMGIAANQAEDYAKNSIGLAKVMGTDVAEAARALAQAHGGVWMTLERQLPALRAVHSQQEKMAMLSRLAAQGMDLERQSATTFTGQMKQLKNQLGDIGETIGAALMPVMQKLANWLKAAADVVQKLVGQNAKLIASFVATAAAIAGACYIVPKLIGLFTMLAAHPVVAVLAGIALLVTLLDQFKTRVSDTTPQVERMSSALADQHYVHARLVTRLKELLSYTDRTNAEQQEANDLARQLTQTYGDLGVVYDEFGNAVGMAADAMTRFTQAAQTQMSLAWKKEIGELDKALGELTALEVKMHEERRSGWWMFTRGGPATEHGWDPWGDKAFDAEMAKLDAQRKELLGRRSDLENAMRANQYDPQAADAEARSRASREALDNWQKVDKAINEADFSEYQKKIQAVEDQYQAFIAAGIRAGRITQRQGLMGDVITEGADAERLAEWRRKRQQEVWQGYYDTLAKLKAEADQATMSGLDRELAQIREQAEEKKKLAMGNAQALADIARWQAAREKDARDRDQKEKQEAADRERKRAADKARTTAHAQAEMMGELYKELAGEKAMREREIADWQEAMNKRFAGNAVALALISKTAAQRRAKLNQDEQMNVPAFRGMAELGQRLQEAALKADQKKLGEQQLEANRKTVEWLDKLYNWFTKNMPGVVAGVPVLGE